MGITGSPPSQHRKRGKMNLLQKIESLREQQIASIALMRDNYRALNNIEHRDFHLGPMKVRAIYNPARVISSAAKVDAASIAARPCFLCTQNRLEGQRSVPFLDGRYDILVNPYPIFDHHYVIAAHSAPENRQTHHRHVAACQ